MVFQTNKWKIACFLSVCLINISKYRKNSKENWTLFTTNKKYRKSRHFPMKKTLFDSINLKNQRNIGDFVS